MHTISIRDKIKNHKERALIMNIRVDSKVLWTIAAVLIALWLLGFGFSYRFYGLIHILLVIAIIIIIINFLTNRK